MLLLGLARAGAEDTLRPWEEYRTIMWIGDSAYQQPDKVPLFFQRLREMGINTGMVHGDASLQPVLSNQFPYYVENMVNRGLCLKWNSTVRDWDKAVTDWAKSGRAESALVRDYCLDDPAWRDWARGEMQGLVRKNRDHQPVAYQIRDELSTTISANPFDYDFNPIALAGFRDWLKTVYPDLAALNAQWETQFGSWDDVRPFTTDQIKNRMASGEAQPRGQPDWQAVARLRFDPATAPQNRTRWNFSPWADFRTYMDLSLARALAGLREAARELDSRTPVGIEGTQMPHAFGGYDLWRLAQAIDWVEPYDIGNARDIFGSFMPGKTVLTTVFENDTPRAQRRLWHVLLEGDRGCIIWWSEDCIDWKSADYALTPKAKALAPVLREMTSPLARLFLKAKPERDPIFLHYSQPSIQVDWLLESTVDGSTWLRRFSSFESSHNRQAKVRNAWLKAFQDLGFSPQFLSSAQIEAGALRTLPPRAALVLPSSWALSDREAREMRSWTSARDSRAPALFADAAPGWFDEHGKLRRESALPALNPPLGASLLVCAALTPRQPSSSILTNDVAQYAIDRLKPQFNPAFADWIKNQLPQAEAAPSLPLSARARIHRFRIGAHRLLAIERNIDYQMSEDLKQAGGNEALEQPASQELTLAKPAHVYDLRARKYLGLLDKVPFTLEPWQPALFALTDKRVPEASILAELEKP